MATLSHFHVSLKPIGRSTGRSAVACAAYRTGTRMTDERYAAVRDFSSKGDVVTSFTVAPESAPSWATDAEQLWNAVEAKENRKNSQVAQEWEIALPNELTDAAREGIARRFAGWLVDEYGVAVTTGIHEGGTRGNGLNDHMHVMMTMRKIGSDGWVGNKLRVFSTRPGAPNPEVERVRECAADFINDALEEAGSENRVDHRSYEARGIDKVPTTHLGPAASAMERKHRHSSDRGDINREIIEERLAWQREQDLPEITPELEHEFSQRWEGWSSLARGVDTETTPPLEHGAPAATEEEHRGWRVFVDRVRAFGAGFVEFLRDETSGTPEEERGFAARIFDAGAKLVGGWRHHEGRELVEGIDDTALIVRDLVAKGPRPSIDDKPHKSFTERLRDNAVEMLKNERGAVPDAFDKQADAWLSAPAPDESAAPPNPPENDIRSPDGPDIE